MNDEKMDVERVTRERNAVKILALSGEGYLQGLDELCKSFVSPQIQMAIHILNTMVEERSQVKDETPELLMEVSKDSLPNENERPPVA